MLKNIIQKSLKWAEKSEKKIEKRIKKGAKIFWMLKKVCIFAPKD